MCKCVTEISDADAMNDFVSTLTASRKVLRQGRRCVLIGYGLARGVAILRSSTVSAVVSGSRSLVFSSWTPSSPDWGMTGNKKTADDVGSNTGIPFSSPRPSLTVECRYVCRAHQGFVTLLACRVCQDFSNAGCWCLVRRAIDDVHVSMRQLIASNGTNPGGL